MPRRLIVTENITVDSVIEMTGDWFVPAGADNADAVAEMRVVEKRLRATADALLVGRATFEAFRGYWPQQAEDQTGIRDYLNQVDKYVVSATLTDAKWDRTTIVRGPLADEVAGLKAKPGGDIVATGSITMVHALNRTGLVDEYRLFVYPVALGSGRRLFEEPTDKPNLQLIEAHPFSTGVVLLRYRTR